MTRRCPHCRRNHKWTAKTCRRKHARYMREWRAARAVAGERLRSVIRALAISCA